MYEQEQLTLSQVILEEGGLRGGGLDQGVLDEHVLGLGEMKICSRWELVKIKRSSWKEYGRRSEIYICDQLVCGSGFQFWPRSPMCQNDPAMFVRP